MNYICLLLGCSIPYVILYIYIYIFIFEYRLWGREKVLAGWRGFLSGSGKNCSSMGHSLMTTFFKNKINIIIQGINLNSLNNYLNFFSLVITINNLIKNY